MVLLESANPDFQKTFHPFKLKGVDHQLHSSDTLMKQNGLFIIFTCNHCPYANAMWDRLIQDEPNFKKLNMGMVAINPNDHPNYPTDGFNNMVELARKKQLLFPYLFDEGQHVARLYGAVCTPDFFVLNANYQLIYRRAYDDSWEDASEVTQTFLMDAVTHYSQSLKIQGHSKWPSRGCSIKWQNTN